MNYNVTVSYSGTLNYTVEAENEEEAREITEHRIYEDDSNIIADIQNNSDIYVEEE